MCLICRMNVNTMDRLEGGMGGGFRVVGELEHRVALILRDAASASDRSVCPGARDAVAGYALVPRVLSDRMPTVPRPGARPHAAEAGAARSTHGTTPPRGREVLIRGW
ncbi:hypothetical protein GCM10027282_07750 [Frigoribacterium salinisoli]